MKQPTPSKAALVNAAAKDDTIHLSSDGTFTLDQLLANDPGSAKFDRDAFLDQNPGISYDAITHTFHIDDPAAFQGGFNYSVQMANGVTSTAHVTIASQFVHGEELLQNTSFTADTVVGSDYSAFSTIAGWHNDGGGALEVVKASYGNIGSDQWLDTQASPGGVTISQDVDLATGEHATLAVSVAKEIFAGLTPGSTLTFTFNGETVLELTEADFENFNTLKTFSQEVTGADGADHLVISDNGTGLVGFALDSVSLTTHDHWVI